VRGERGGALDQLADPLRGGTHLLHHLVLAVVVEGVAGHEPVVELHQLALEVDGEVLCRRSAERVTPPGGTGRGAGLRRRRRPSTIPTTSSTSSVQMTILENRKAVAWRTIER